MSAINQYRIPRMQLSWQLGIALAVNVLSLALPIMMLQVYDRIIPHQSYGTLVLLIIGVVTALVFDVMLRMARAYLASWTSVHHEHKASCHAMEHLMNADIVAVEKESIGTHLQGLSALSRLREFYSGQAMMALIDLPFAALFLGLIAYIGGWLALVPLALLAVFIVTARYFGENLRNALDIRNDDDNKKSNFIVSVLSGIHTVKAKGMETLMMRRFEEKQNKITKDSYQVALASGASTILSSVFGQLALVLTVTIGSLLVIKGTLSIGGLSACTLLAGRTIQPVQRVLGAWLRLQDLAISRKQANEIFTLPQQQRAANDLPVMQGNVSIYMMSFGFASDEEPLLKNITLDVQAGEAIAIKGEKGSGKTTLLEMIAGMHKPRGGKITIDGIDPVFYPPSFLKEIIGYLPQQGTIFKGTILENITGFRDDESTIAKAKTIAKDLGLEEVINQLPRGYQTRLTDSPSDPIPPGVKQRIALARVLLNRPKLILFDDADRTLDKEGYNRLFCMMGELKGTCTLIIASHDENLLSFADRSYVLRNARLFAETENATQRIAYLNHHHTER